MAVFDPFQDPCLQIMPTAGDGHCLLYAIMISWTLQLSTEVPPTLHVLKCGIFLESLQHRDLYRSYLHDIRNNSDYTTSVARYLLYKHYNCTFGDIMPVIIANAFDLSIKIKDTNSNGDINEIAIHPRNGPKERELLIHRSNEHFSGIKITNNSVSTTTLTSSHANFKKIVYTKSELCAINSNQHRLKRKVRKCLFKHKLWQPAWYRNGHILKINDKPSENRHKSLIVIPLTSNHSCESKVSDQLLGLKSGLNFGNWNARSINNKTSEVCDLIQEYNLDLLAVTESWLTARTKTSTMAQIMSSLTSFDYISQDRKGRAGGGICVLFRDTLTVQQQSNVECKSFELLDLLITSVTDKLRLVIIYRPPNTKTELFLTEFSSILEILAIAEEKLLITGDFNIHMENITVHLPRNLTTFLKQLA